jgi:hypothetical protein
MKRTIPELYPYYTRHRNFDLAERFSNQELVTMIETPPVQSCITVLIQQ